MVAELERWFICLILGCSLAKISMVAERTVVNEEVGASCSLAKISMVAERVPFPADSTLSCSLAKISMVAEPQNI